MTEMLAGASVIFCSKPAAVTTTSARRVSASSARAGEAPNTRASAQQRGRSGRSERGLRGVPAIVGNLQSAKRGSVSGWLTGGKGAAVGWLQNFANDNDSHFKLQRLFRNFG